MAALFIVTLLLSALPVRAQETPAAAPPPVTVRARVEPATATVGTRVRYWVEIEAPGDAKLLVPVLGERLADFHVVDFGEITPRVENGRIFAARWFDLVAYEPGDKTIPGFPIKYALPDETTPRDASANEVVVVIDSLVAKEPAASDIRDIAPPEPVPWDWRPAAFLAAGLAAILGLGVGLYRLLNRERAVAATKPPPPHEVALEGLARLRARRLLEAGEYEAFYVALSAVVRTYVENRFGLRAPEMTTEEFLAAMQRDRRLTADHRSLLGAFLTDSDLVKFARHHPTLEDAERAFAAARRFVDESRLGPRAEEISRAAA